MTAITIPENAIIECPQRGFAKRKATACASCMHCRGVYAVPNVSESAPFHVRFRITCAYPLNRGLSVILED